MKTSSHHAIRRVECLFDAVPMMHVHVYIQDAGVDAEEFEDAENAAPSASSPYE